MPVDDGATMAALDALVLRLDDAARRGAGDAALVIQEIGMGKTPVRTGTLRRSWHMEGPTGGDGVYRAETAPSTVYARRIELGFQGPDSLGRVYHQAPAPYVLPARLEGAGRARSVIASRVSAAIKG